MNFDHLKNRQITNPETNNSGQPHQNLINRKCKKYFMVDAETKVYFNADFDSGNLEKVQQISPYIYRLCPGYDKVTNTTDKTFFHFKVFGFRMCTVRLHINRVHILQKLLRSGQQSSYRPVVKRGKGRYEPLTHGVKIYYNRLDEAELSIQYQFEDEDTWTYFAFSYPYPYQQMIDLVKELELKYSNHSDIYFHSEVLGYSQQGRKLQMITITQKMNCSKQNQQPIPGILPQREVKPCLKISKPKIIISGRVHPGQTPSSFCVEGLLRFLLDEKDYRSYLLRKNFHFLIIPMLNPDGVYQGLFRNDLNGDNLNRVYVSCSKAKHPTIWSFRQYLKHLKSTEQSVMFYYDFHAHPSRKQFFIYGNAFNEYTHQVEAETFGKLLENNCPYFYNVDSIFTQKQMNSKDKYDVFTKEGCGRVYVHRLFNIIHSYTVQCGYFSPGKLQKWQSVETILNRSQVLSKQYQYVGTWEKCSAKTYTIESYMLMGKSILCTILDLFHLNPYTRINLNELRSISTIRKSVGIKVYNCVQRFRLIDANVTKKLKQLTKILEQQYYKIRLGQYGLSISQNYGMKHPKKTFSLLSRVYLSKNQLKIHLNSLDPEINLDIVQENDEGFQAQNIESSRPFLQSHQENTTNLDLQSQIISHSQNFKQFKSQLELKMPKSFGSMKKIEQKYFSEVSHQCLHVSKLNSGQMTQYSNKLEHSNVEEENIGNKDKIQNVDQRIIKSQIIKQILLKNKKKSGSQKTLNLLKMEKLSSKRSGTQEKIDVNPYSLSLAKKSEKLLKISDIQKRLVEIAEIKSSRLDAFLKKQSQRQKDNDIASQIQKYVNLKVQQGLKHQPFTSRFPSLYQKNIEKEKKKTIK